jgi:hypothetical protein
MPTVLQDPAIPDPSVSVHTPPLPPADPLFVDRRNTLGQSRFECAGDVVSFDLESPGGYARTVTGTVAFLDREAETYMVLAPNGALVRVPLRDVKATRGIA